MRTSLDCLPCFLKQALHTLRLLDSDQAGRKEIMDEVAMLLPGLDLALSPPENARFMYECISRRLGVADPFAAIKEESNRFALGLRPQLEERLHNSREPLLAAVLLAIAGNIIDYGALHELDAAEVLGTCLDREPAVNDFERFRYDLEKAESILYLADNAGETVFDRLLIETLGRPVIYAVRGEPAINDALLADALACGLDKVATIITSGSDCPGTVLARCDPAFRQAFRQADLIISKGQGNFETLVGERGPIYFLLTLKCPVVGAHVAAEAGDRLRGAPSQGELVIMKAKPG